MTSDIVAWASKGNWGYRGEGGGPRDKHGEAIAWYDIKDRLFHRATHKECVDGARGVISEEINNVSEGDTKGHGEETQGKRWQDSLLGKLNYVLQERVKSFVVVNKIWRTLLLRTNLRWSR